MPRTHVISAAVVGERLTPDGPDASAPPTALALTIAMPVHDEEASIGEVVSQALAALDELDEPGEVLVVDDGSTDGTPDILRRLSRRDKRIRVVSNEINLGIRSFNRRMLSSARGEWVFFISSDGEFDCREALRLLDAARQQDVDAVLGYRAAKRYTPYRRAVSALFNSMVRACFGVRFRDIGSIRLLRRTVFAPIPLYSQSAFINAERLLAARRLGARFIELPVEHRPRIAGRGRGARPGKVVAAFGDLIKTRIRWFRFAKFYGEGAVAP